MLNLLWQWPQLYGFSPVCLKYSLKYMWVFKSYWRLNVLKHYPRLYGFSPVCINMCVAKWLDWLNFFRHCYLYAFFSLCISMWAFKFDCWLNYLRHLPQLYGFTPICVSMWNFKAYCDLNSFRQWSQLNFPLLGWVFKWIFERGDLIVGDATSSGLPLLF
jgi:hypothetical protein